MATGAGHTALAFAPLVDRVVASDITDEMLAQTAKLAAARQLKNVETAHAEAGELAFAEASFDLVTCRLAAHHFPDPTAFVAAAWRVLKPGGTFALVDNVGPDAARMPAATPAEIRDADTLYNTYEELRDPSHARALGPRGLARPADRRRLRRRCATSGWIRTSPSRRGPNACVATPKRSSASSICSTTTSCAPSCVRAMKRASASSRCRKPSSSRASRQARKPPMTNITDWQRATAPELTDFEDMAEAAWSRLPEAFRARAGDVLIRVEDYPTDEVLDSLGIDDPLDLLGLYHGVSLDKKSLSDLPSQPDMVFLYRRPHAG